MATGRRLRRNQIPAYEYFRRQLGRAILLGLELLVAADIVRTVATTPDAESVGVLAGNCPDPYLPQLFSAGEMTGAWPWQRRQSESANTE
jgi:hypothetical protein